MKSHEIQQSDKKYSVKCASLCISVFRGGSSAQKWQNSSLIHLIGPGTIFFFFKFWSAFLYSFVQFNPILKASAAHRPRDNLHREAGLKHHIDSTVYEQECGNPPSLSVAFFDLYAHSIPTNIEAKD